MTEKEATAILPCENSWTDVSHLFAKRVSTPRALIFSFYGQAAVRLRFVFSLVRFDWRCFEIPRGDVALPFQQAESRFPQPDKS